MTVPNNDLVLRATDEVQRELVIKRTDDEIIVSSTVVSGFGGSWNAGWAMGKRARITYRLNTTLVMELCIDDACFDITLREAVRIATFLNIPLPVLPAAVGANPSPPSARRCRHPFGRARLTALAFFAGLSVGICLAVPVVALLRSWKDKGGGP